MKIISLHLSELSGDREAADEPEVRSDPLAEQSELVCEIGQKQDSNERKLAQALRENANFRIQMRSGMQRDLDDLKRGWAENS